MASIEIRGVANQRQVDPRPSWYACLHMAVRYFGNSRQASIVSLRVPEDFPPTHIRFTPSSDPKLADWHQWVEQCGFTAMNLTPNQNRIFQYLSQYGPIVYSGTWGYAFDGHAVILTGLDTVGGTVYVDDTLELLTRVSKFVNTYFGQVAQMLRKDPVFAYAD